MSGSGYFTRILTKLYSFEGSWRKSEGSKDKNRYKNIKRYKDDVFEG